MKNNINLLKGLLLMVMSLGLQQVMAADDPQVEKRKTYSKSYELAGNDKITLSNQFGEVKINTWAKNEIKVDVTIIASSSTEERAQQLLDQISIEDGKNANGVHFTTHRKKDVRKNGDKTNYKNESSQTNYLVFMPAGNNLNISNQFGATILPDFNGLLDVESKFGALTAGKLTNVKKVEVEFGNAQIESISGSTLAIRFSRAIIDRLDGSINASFEHCSGIKLRLENSLKQLKVSNNFTTLYLDVDKNFSGEYRISTNFGNFSNKTAFNIGETQQDNKKGPKFSKNYSGKSGNGSAGVNISSEFSNVILGHDIDMNLKEEKKTTTKI